MNRIIVSIVALAASLSTGAALADETHTRGVGVYPGDPAEDFSPTLVPAPAGRRNLALHRPASQSSAWDYNLVAQLLTDGIRESSVPRWFSVSTRADGTLP